MGPNSGTIQLPIERGVRVRSIYGQAQISNEPSIQLQLRMNQLRPYQFFKASFRSTLLELVNVIQPILFQLSFQASPSIRAKNIRNRRSTLKLFLEFSEAARHNVIGLPDFVIENLGYEYAVCRSWTTVFRVRINRPPLFLQLLPEY